MMRVLKSWDFLLLLAIVFIITMVAVLCAVKDAKSLERCNKYLSRVTRESNYHIGVGYYCKEGVPITDCFMNQIVTESACRNGATAFDGGQGLGQFMPATAEWAHRKFKDLQEYPFNPYDPNWNIRAMILYDKHLYGISPCSGWYWAFRAYNGGMGNLKKEIKRAEYCCIPEQVEKECRRKKLQMRWGVLDFCEVNIDYAYKVMKPYVR